MGLGIETSAPRSFHTDAGLKIASDRQQEETRNQSSTGGGVLLVLLGNSGRWMYSAGISPVSDFMNATMDLTFSGERFFPS